MLYHVLDINNKLLQYYWFQSLFTLALYSVELCGQVTSGEGSAE